MNFNFNFGSLREMELDKLITRMPRDLFALYIYGSDLKTAELLMKRLSEQNQIEIAEDILAIAETGGLHRKAIERAKDAVVNEIMKLADEGELGIEGWEERNYSKPIPEVLSYLEYLAKSLEKKSDI